MLSNKQAPICSIQTKNLQEEIKAKTYVGKRFIINNKFFNLKWFDFFLLFIQECSSITKSGVKNVFDEAIKAVLSPEGEKPCIIL